VLTPEVISTSGVLLFSPLTLPSFYTLPFGGGSGLTLYTGCGLGDGNLALLRARKVPHVRQSWTLTG
jgi:hypothetical protein